MEAKEKGAQQLCTPLLDNLQEGEGEGEGEVEESVCIDWLGRPAGGRPHELGGWKCSICIMGAAALGGLAFYGVLYNLVLYVIQVCGKSNAAAANFVSDFAGTALLCSFVGALLSDAYMGRLWASVIFQGLTTLLFALTSIIVTVISMGPATALESSLLFATLYLLAISTGPVLPNLLALGADQLSTAEEKQRYFKVSTILSATGQFVAATAVTYIDNEGMWGWGFWISTAAVAACLLLLAAPISRLRQFRAGGNPLLRNIQVIVAACRKYSHSVPSDPSLLHECQGKLSAILGCRKVQHTGSLRFLDKAAVVADSLDATAVSPWHLCTVSQVEELKSVLRAIPVGMAVILVSTVAAQTNTLFEEQANEMNRQVTPWLAIPPAALNLFSTMGSILTGIVITVGGTKLPGCWCGRRGRVTSLQLQGVALVFGMMAMLVAALVESYRLREAEKGSLISIMWLVPQTFLVGAGLNLATSGGSDFFYSEVADGMRTVGSSFLYIFMGAGNYVSAILVALVTAISTRGGGSGWIASDLNDGHVDYFYGLLTLCLALTLGVYILYTRFVLHPQRN